MQSTGDTSTRISRSEIIDYLRESGLAARCLSYQMKGAVPAYWKEEMRQEMWLWLLTYDEDKLADAYRNNHLNALITRYLQNQLRSSTSAFYRRYKRPSLYQEEIGKEALNVPEI